jgi:hypothetical protein
MLQLAGYVMHMWDLRNPYEILIRKPLAEICLEHLTGKITSKMEFRDMVLAQNLVQ